MMPPTLREACALVERGEAVTTAYGADALVTAFREVVLMADNGPRHILVERAALHIEAAYHLVALAETLDLSDA